MAACIYIIVVEIATLKLNLQFKGYLFLFLSLIINALELIPLWY